MAGTLRFATRLAVWLVIFGQPWQACCAQVCGEPVEATPTAASADLTTSPVLGHTPPSRPCCAAVSKPLSPKTAAGIGCCGKKTPAPTNSNQRVATGCGERKCSTTGCSPSRASRPGSSAAQTISISPSPRETSPPTTKSRGCCGSSGCTPSQSVCCAGEYFPKLPPQSADDHRLDTDLFALVPFTELVAQAESLTVARANYNYPIPWETHAVRQASLSSWLK